uniref:Pectinesterase n=2 Tax=Physcomitrium patens TaxID=3218 RepID=A0A2K1J7G9_PHYPA|nr:probable pectinesterase 53 isoform X1 [Physcomitrium patens]PNR37458.1 hypothetical protein PHYPA_020567 [Physcomitrium patens]|eukprot:XP_024399458.1 probable pectinesterase 53 isoform X1 [Physcomitrella patens]
MAIFRNSLLYIFVLVAGSFLVVSLQVDSAPDQSFNAWAVGERAEYEAKQAASPHLGIQDNPDGDFNTAAKPTPVLESCLRIVGKKVSGAKYKKVKSAINSIPKGNSARCVVMIGEDFYKEKIKIPKEKPYVTIEGAGANKTVLSCHDYAGKVNSTYKSASFAVMSDYFIAKDVTFEKKVVVRTVNLEWFWQQNSHPLPSGGEVGQQAVAFRIEGDKAQFYRVALLGAQDTLYDMAGRHYFKDCYIQGSIDFIFGSGQSYYETCHLHSIANPGSGSLTAQKRGTGVETSGFSFVRFCVTGNGPIYLGRAWGPYSRVVFLYTDIAAPIISAGWYNWNDPEREKTVYNAQYKCTGVEANTTGRAWWSKELTDAEAASFLSWDLVDGKEWIGRV